jgi:hypothetical protein
MINRVARTELAAISFLNATGVSPRSQLTYLGHLQAMLKPLSPLQKYKRGLQRIGSTDPMKQALPASRQHIDTLMAKMIFNRSLRVAIWLAWKTASRWGDIFALRGSSILLADQTAIIIYWGPHTKTSQSGTKLWAPHLFTVILPNVKGLDTAIWPAAVSHLKSLQPNQSLTQISTDNVTKLIKQSFPTLSAHSIKRGAVTLLIDAGCPHELISRLAKHAAPNTFSSTTLAYGASATKIAWP